MIAIIRIKGQVKVDWDVKETLHRLRIRRKYACTLINATPENLKLIKKIRNFVAYGTIDEKTLLELIAKRAMPKEKSQKIDPEKIIKELKEKPITKLNIKPFFRLHPPRGGIDAKKHFGVSKKAVLGDNKEKINDLIRRML